MKDRYEFPINTHGLILATCKIEDMNLDDAEHFLNQGKTFEEFVEKIDWKKFEQLIKDVFSVHGFHSVSNFRFKTSKRFEIDIIAVKDKVAFAVDCKEWDKGRYKDSGLRKAAADQIQRTNEFKKFFEKNPIARSRLKLSVDSEVTPLVVTWYEENVAGFANCFIIPAWKLNTFLLSYDSY